MKRRPRFHPLASGPIIAIIAAALFGASTPLAKLLVQEANPWLLAGLLYLGSGIGLALVRLIRRLVAGSQHGEGTIRGGRMVLARRSDHGRRHCRPGVADVRALPHGRIGLCPAPTKPVGVDPLESNAADLLPRAESAHQERRATKLFISLTQERRRRRTNFPEILRDHSRADCESLLVQCRKRLPAPATESRGTHGVLTVDSRSPKLS